MADAKADRVPEIGDYLTDGVRLFQVVEKAGALCWLEDAKLGTLLKLPLREVLELRPVKP